MKINKERLKKHLMKLGSIGYTEGQGITRQAFTPTYEEAKKYVRNLMENIGLKVYEDSVGNLFGKLEGKGKKKSIIMGSHIDSVPNGGIFDGSLGVLGAIECIQTLMENNHTTQYDLEVAAFIGEEGTEVGGTFGSKCFTGEVSFQEKDIAYLETVGISKEDIRSAKRSPKTVKHYLELHIEQGNILDTEGLSIGIVKGIVGIAQYKAEVKGKANHAGTTPMHLRDDALVKASKVINQINEIVNQLGAPLVGTVGHIQAHPGAINVIPGKVDFTIELRDVSKERVETAMNLVKESCKDLNLSIEKLEYEWEVNLDQDIQSEIEKACKDLGYNYKFMYSGAGHDANPLSKIASTGMIFVPSKNGISHAPGEWTEWEDIDKGVNTLLLTLLHLDKE